MPDSSLMVVVDILGGARRYISGFGSMYQNSIPVGEEEEELDDGHRLPRTKYGSELDLTGAAIALDTEPQHPPGDYRKAGFLRCKQGFSTRSFPCLYASQALQFHSWYAASMITFTMTHRTFNLQVSGLAFT